MRCTRPADVRQVGLLAFVGALLLTNVPAARADPADGTWSAFQLANGAPPQGFSAVADPVNHKMYMVGPASGQPGHPRVNEVFELDLAASPAEFHRLVAVGPGPTERVGAVLIMDMARHRLLLIGGESQYISITTTEVWELTLGERPAWREVIPNGPAPGPRRSHFAIMDPSRDRIIVSGGESRPSPNESHYLQDTWVLDLSPDPTWSRPALAGITPPAFYSAVGAYDSRRNRMLVLGTDLVAQQRELLHLTLDGIPTWSQLPAEGDAAGAVQSAVYDSIADRVLVVGQEEDPSERAVLSQLILGPTNHWENVPATGADAGATVGVAAFFQADRHLVTFGGDDARSLNVDTGVREDLEPLGTWPAFGSYAVAAYDSVGARVFAVLRSPVAGHPDELWVLHLAGEPRWQKPAVESPPPLPSSLSNFLPVFDNVRGRLLALDGGSGQVWELQGTPRLSWSLIPTTGPGPSPRSGASVTYDPVRGRVYMFGGSGGGTVNSELWELAFDAEPHWTLVSAIDPKPRTGASIAYDPVGDQIVVTGGYWTYPAGAEWASQVLAWTLGGAGGQWQDLTPAGPVPSPRAGASFVRDPARNRFLFGGALGVSDVWSLVLGTTNTWTRLQPDGVQPIGQFGLGPGFFEASRDELVFPFIGSALRWGAVPAPELTCPPDGSWSPGSIRDVNFELRDLAGVGFTYEYVISCERAWPGFPIQGSLSLAFSTERIQVGLPVPDTAAFGPVRFGVAVVPRGEPGLITHCAFTLAGEPAPVVAINAVAQPGRALVRWRTSRRDLEVTIARRDEAGAWTAQVRRTVSTPGEVAYEDHDVRINQRYYYRLEVSDAFLSGSYGTMRVDIPTWSFGFAPGQPVLLKSEFAVACDVAERGVVELEAFDVCGRRVAAETRSVAGPGRIEFDLDPHRTASSGVYLLRLTQGALTSRMRVIRIR